MPYILSTVVAGAISWFVWLALRNFVVRSPLDKIPGPKSTSRIKGTLPMDGWLPLAFGVETVCFRKPDSDIGTPCLAIPG